MSCEVLPSPFWNSTTAGSASEFAGIPHNGQGASGTLCDEAVSPLLFILFSLLTDEGALVWLPVIRCALNATCRLTACSLARIVLDVSLLMDSLVAHPTNRFFSILPLPAQVGE